MFFLGSNFAFKKNKTNKQTKRKKKHNVLYIQGGLKKKNGVGT